MKKWENKIYNNSGITVIIILVALYLLLKVV